MLNKTQFSLSILEQRPNVYLLATCAEVLILYTRTDLLLAISLTEDGGVGLFCAGLVEMLMERLRPAGKAGELTGDPATTHL